jgi:hypothetical protein
MTETWRATTTPFDVATSPFGAPVIMDTLATVAERGHLGARRSREQRERAELERNQAAEGVD